MKKTSRIITRKLSELNPGELAISNDRYLVENDLIYEPRKPQHTSFVVVGDYKETDSKFDIDEFDIKLSRKNYRLFIDKASNEIWCRKIAEYDSKGDPIFQNPRVDDDFVKGLIEFANNSLAPENKKLNSINKFVREWRRQKLKNKPKSKRGRKEEDYLRRAILWAIENQVQKENRTKVARRAYHEFKDEAQSEIAFVKSVTNKWGDLTKLYRKKYPNEKDENGKYKSRVSFKAFAKKYLKSLQTKEKNYKKGKIKSTLDF